jgi:hypothetical protein
VTGDDLLPGVLSTNVMRLVVFIFGLVLQKTILSSLLLVIPEDALVLGIHIRPLGLGSHDEALVSELSGVLGLYLILSIFYAL